jgi:hypothetical protein
VLFLSGINAISQYCILDKMEKPDRFPAENMHAPTVMMYERDVPPNDYRELPANMLGEELVRDHPILMKSGIDGQVEVDHQVEPRESDILLGRGGRNNQNGGNQMLRKMVHEVYPAYMYSGKTEKAEIARRLVKKVHSLTPPGR